MTLHAELTAALDALSSQLMAGDGADLRPLRDVLARYDPVIDGPWWDEIVSLKAKLGEAKRLQREAFMEGLRGLPFGWTPERTWNAWLKKQKEMYP